MTMITCERQGHPISANLSGVRFKFLLVYIVVVVVLEIGLFDSSKHVNTGNETPCFQDLLKQIHYSTLDKGTVVEEMVVGKEETVGVIGSDSEEALVIKEEGSPLRVHQEFLKNVVEINSHRT